MAGKAQIFHTTDEAGWLVVRFDVKQISGMDAVEQIKNTLCDSIAARPHLQLLIDFAGVDYLSSAFLGVMIGLQRRLRTTDGRLRLCSLSPLLQQIMEISGLDKCMDIKSTVEESFAAVESQPANS